VHNHKKEVKTKWVMDGDMEEVKDGVIEDGGDGSQLVPLKDWSTLNHADGDTTPTGKHPKEK